MADLLAYAYLVYLTDASDNVINPGPIGQKLCEIQRYEEPGSMPNQPRSLLLHWSCNGSTEWLIAPCIYIQCTCTCIILCFLVSYHIHGFYCHISAAIGKNVVEWFNDNEMQANPNKFQVLIFSHSPLSRSSKYRLETKTRNKSRGRYFAE